MTNKERPYLGLGWSFPPVFDQQKGGVRMVSEEEDIAESLQVLLSTRLGERVLRPSFGCNLDVMLFEPLTTTLVTYVQDLIRTAILYHEPRIKLDFVKVQTEQVPTGLILIELEYTVLTFNSRYNLVYPFYLEEGHRPDAIDVTFSQIT